MAKFRKKPVVIEAKQWDGQPDTANEILEWSNGTVAIGNNDTLVVITKEGTMAASLHDWIIKGVKGEYYPCKPDIFEATYEPIEQ